MISHRNVIANTMQICTMETPYRQKLRQPGDKHDPTEVALGLLPQSHIYSLVVICHASVYRGDRVVTLPKFELQSFLNAIQRFKINGLYLVSVLRTVSPLCLTRDANTAQVPPIVVTMLKNKAILDKFDLSSVSGFFTGAAPLGEETAESLQKQYPSWKIRQGYGIIHQAVHSGPWLIGSYRTHRNFDCRMFQRCG